ncbi:FUSC family protein [Enterococcus faecalis]|uniref:FUSC family protein n=1 Tax=Enterococcus faecalis TaxID=1351 RepID=UPI00398545C4
MIRTNISPYLAGTIISTALSIFHGYFFYSNICIVYSVLGAFSYTFFSAGGLKINVRNIFIHGFLLLVGYNYGLFIHYFPDVLPFSLALLFSTCYLFSEVYLIKNPKYFYVILLFAVGLKGLGKFNMKNILATNLYVLFGIIFSIISVILIFFIYRSSLGKNNYNIDHRFNALSLTDKIYYRIFYKPKLLIVSLHGAFTFFIIGYLVVVLGIDDSVWIIISCTAIISAEEIFLIRKKFKERILGSLIGILLGYLVLIVNLPLEVNLVLLLIMNALFEFFLKKNYLIANIFTNPLVLILAQLVTQEAIFIITIHRLFYLVLGAIVGYFSMIVFYYCLDHIYYYK